MNKDDLKSIVMPMIGVSPLFQVIWGSGYADVKDKAKIRNVDLGHFAEDNGYSEEDIKLVSSLDIGEAHTFDNLTCISSVVRII